MTERDTDDPKLVVYSDYLCPFCYLGKRSLESYFESAGVEPEVEWHPFDIQGHKRGPDRRLDDDVDDGKDEAYFERAKRNVERLADEYDVEMEVDIHEDIDSWDAQKLALGVARECDSETFHALHEALFVALWQEGRDIGDRDVLTDIAREQGIDRERVERILEDETLDDELEQQFADARARGIRGIPTFVFDGRAAQGAIPPQRFQPLFE